MVGVIMPEALKACSGGFPVFIQQYQNEITDKNLNITGILYSAMSDKKVLVMGIDGLDPNLVRAWRNDLPTLDRMMEEGHYGILESTIPPITVPAWASLYTGLKPDKIGVYVFRERKKNEYKWRYINVHDVKGKAIWDVLSEYGKKSIVFNVPITYPPKQINGIIVTGLLTPSTKSNYTYPKDLKKKLEEVAGNFLYDPKDISGKDVYLYASELVDIQKKAMLFLINNYEWDFFFGVFNSSDIISHFYMKKPETKSKEVKEIYMKIDRALSEILDSIKDNFYLVVVSDHGFGYMKGNFNVNNWLAEKGYLKIKKKRSRINAKKLYMMIKRIGVPYFILSRLSQIDQSFINKFIPLEENDVFSGIMDWERTKAYCTDVGLIYINEKGREPMGIVEPRQKIGIINEIIDKLKTCQYVDHVYNGSEIYSSSSYNTPDIVLSTFENELNPSAYIGDNIIERHPKWTGTHRQNGFYLISGNSFLQKQTKLEITDIFPLVLNLYGITDYNIQNDKIKQLRKRIKKVRRKIG